MAAGLGFKTFATGDVLTAADTNGYLMQGVWVFADAAARDAAVTSPQEGNFAYLKDTNTTTYYTGSAWTNLDTTGMVNPMTTTGDTIYSSSGSTPARLGIGSTGQVLTVAGGVPSWATPASGTINWTQRTALTNKVNHIAYNGTNLYVAVGNAGVLQTSSDGITWTARTSGFGANNIHGVAFGNGLWVAVGNNGTITTSSDGITWTARTANMSTNQLYQALYANSIWVVVGTGGGTTNTGGLTYSTDGITWTRKSQSLTVGQNYFSLTYNGSNWIIGADIATNNYLYASTPSGTWTVGTDGSGADLNEVFYDGTRTLVIVSNGTLRYSTSATLGTTTQIVGVTLNTATTNTPYSYYNGKIWNLGTGFFAVSTTPLSGDYANITNTSTIAPTTLTSSTGGLNNLASSVFVGAAGYIAGTTSPGLLFTSF